jgi:hypothetical protein
MRGQRCPRARPLQARRAPAAAAAAAAAAPGPPRPGAPPACCRPRQGKTHSAALPLDAAEQLEAWTTLMPQCTCHRARTVGRCGAAGRCWRRRRRRLAPRAAAAAAGQLAGPIRPGSRAGSNRWPLRCRGGRRTRAQGRRGRTPYLFHAAATPDCHPRGCLEPAVISAPPGRSWLGSCRPDAGAAGGGGALGLQGWGCGWVQQPSASRRSPAGGGGGAVNGERGGRAGQVRRLRRARVRPG